MIVVISSTSYRSSDDRDTIVPALLAAEAQAQSEPGVVVYRITIDARDPLRIHGLEIYASEEALRSHLNAPHIHELASASDDAGTTLRLTAYHGELAPLNLRQLLA
jgi:quinol monooxygenase YgiN